MWKKLINFIVVFMLLTVVFTAVQINVKANSSPVAEAGGDYFGSEGVPVEFNASGSIDPDGDKLEYRWNFNGTWTNWSESPVIQNIWYDEVVIPLIITVEVRDNSSTVNDTTELTVYNSPPIVEAGDDIIAGEGDLVCFNGSFTDPGIYDTHSILWQFSNGDYIVNILNPSKIYGDDTFDMVVLTVIDGDHDGRENWGIGGDTLNVTINNVAPNITSINAPSEPVGIGEPLTIIANFTDPGSLDTHIAFVDWGDGLFSGAIVDEEDGSGTALATHLYPEAGVYIINVTVIDDDGGMDVESYEYVVVYDQNAGFVTGGGWFGSPKEAYKDNLNAEGKATFGFVSKYKKGQSTPTGNTQFNFNAEYLHFHSSEYYWLVIAGAKAMYKGIGTISGREGSYKFILTAWDGDLIDSEDTFRIKIWAEDIDGTENVIYDNGKDTPLNGGEIMIHKNGL